MIKELVFDSSHSDLIVVKETTLAEAKAVELLYHEFWRFMEPLNGNTEWAKLTMEQILKEGDLPPGGIRERYHYLSIYSKSSDELIGFVEVYDGYPMEGILYVGSLFIAPHHQRNGFGQEVVRMLFTIAKEKRWNALRLSVDLKNWAALHFWVSQGFVTITKVVGEKILAKSHFAKIELERK